MPTGALWHPSQRGFVDSFAEASVKLSRKKLLTAEKQHVRSHSYNSRYTHLLAVRCSGVFNVLSSPEKHCTGSGHGHFPRRFRSGGTLAGTGNSDGAFCDLLQHRCPWYENASNP